MKQVIQETKGKYFSVVFTKKDGSTRRMTARLGVKKGINGKGMSYDPNEKDLMVVWDAQKNDYRMVNLSTIISFKCGSKFINNRSESV